GRRGAGGVLLGAGGDERHGRPRGGADPPAGRCAAPRAGPAQGAPALPGVLEAELSTVEPLPPVAPPTALIERPTHATSRLAGCAAGISPARRAPRTQEPDGAASAARRPRPARRRRW